MKKKSTQADAVMMAALAEEEALEARESRVGSPRQSTLRFIREFARAYHFEAGCAVAAGIILN